MIAAVERPGQICLVLWVGRVGLHAEAITYCGSHLNAGDGTVQVPDVVFTEGKQWMGVRDKKPHTPCETCRKNAKLIPA